MIIKLFNPKLYSYSFEGMSSGRKAEYLFIYGDFFILIKMAYAFNLSTFASFQTAEGQKRWGSLVFNGSMHQSMLQKSEVSGANALELSDVVDKNSIVCNIVAYFKKSSYLYTRHFIGPGKENCYKYLP